MGELKAKVKLARQGKKGEMWQKIVRKLDGNNRIVALVTLIVVGAISAFGGPDLAGYANTFLAMIGITGQWLHELGIQLDPAQVTFGAYAFFSIVRAIYKRKKGLPDRPTKNA